MVKGENSPVLWTTILLVIPLVIVAYYYICCDDFMEKYLNITLEEKLSTA